MCAHSHGHLVCTKVMLRLYHGVRPRYTSSSCMAMLLFEAKVSRSPTAYTAVCPYWQIGKAGLQGAFQSVAAFRVDISLCMFSFVHCERMCPLLVGVPVTSMGGILQEHNIEVC